MFKFENLKKSKKQMVLVGAVALSLMGTMSFGAYSYFTDQVSVTNEFSVGRVDVQVSETNWNSETDGKNMYPGYTTLKNPTVKNISGVEDNDAYIKATIRFLDVSGNQITDPERDGLILSTLRYDPDQTLTGAQSSAEIGAVPNVNPAFATDSLNESETGKHVFYLNAPLKSAATEDGEEAVLFTTVALGSDLTNEQLSLMGDYQVQITFDAIQSNGFDSVSEAMNALRGESTVSTVQDDAGTDVQTPDAN